MMHGSMNDSFLLYFMRKRERHILRLLIILKLLINILTLNPLTWKIW